MRNALIMGIVVARFLGEHEVKELYPPRYGDCPDLKASADLDKPLETWQERPNRRSGAAAARRAARKRRGKR